MAKGNKKVQDKVEQVQVAGKNESPILRVITFIRPGMKDARYGISRSEGLVILSVNGEAIRLSCRQYYSVLERVEDKKYARIKEGHDISEIFEIRDQNLKLINADLEISLNGANLTNDWLWEFNSRYPELNRGDILAMIDEFGEIQVQ